MATEADSLYEVEVQDNIHILMGDGLHLSADLYMPVPRDEGERFPAILEMIPYRKGDWRFRADYQRMTYLAERGFVGCRVDVRGTGSSPGVAEDEYSERETRDGYEVVEWLAAQPWCNGSVGMWGMSYGGFTSIQVAMLQPPSLKAIFIMYATDDRYTDDVHFIGGCLTGSEFAQYAISQIGMNAMPPNPAHISGNWAEQWKTRLETTPPWLLQWIRNQTDGPYWRRGSLAPDYERITCALYHVGGWADGYINAALRMMERCTGAPRKTLIGPWVHMPPDIAYPGPNVDWLDEMTRFFDHWLKGVENGVMEGPPLVLFLQEYTRPEPFPKVVNGTWLSEAGFPVARSRVQTYYLGAGTLRDSPDIGGGPDLYPHRPTLGTRSGLCWGAGLPPNGLARDQRPDEALSLCYTTETLTEPLDVIGFPEAVLFLRSDAPVAHVAVRLTDVAPDGTSALVSTGILNLTHRRGHDDPQALEPDTLYEIPVKLKATGYRFLAGHRIRLSVASAAWPVIWPSPYEAENALFRDRDHPSRLVLPVVPEADSPLPSPGLKLSPPRLMKVGDQFSKPPSWEITEDVTRQSLTVKISDGETSVFSDQSQLFASEMLEMTAFHNNPAMAYLYNEVTYQLQEHGYEIEIRVTGTIRSTEEHFHVDIQLQVMLNGNLFFVKPWLESIPRRLL